MFLLRCLRFESHVKKCCPTFNNLKNYYIIFIQKILKFNKIMSYFFDLGCQKNSFSLNDKKNFWLKIKYQHNFQKKQHFFQHFDQKNIVWIIFFFFKVKCKIFNTRYFILHQLNLKHWKFYQVRKIISLKFRLKFQNINLFPRQ